jgi:hypothetical protein
LLPAFGKRCGDRRVLGHRGSNDGLLFGAVLFESRLDGRLMSQLSFQFYHLLVAGPQLAASREHTGGSLSWADDQRAVGTQ